MIQPSTKTIVRIAVAAFAVYLSIYYWPVAAGFLRLAAQAVFPLVLGLAIAYPLNIIMGFFERHLFPGSKSSLAARVRPPASIACALLTLVGIFAVIAVLVIPQVVECVRLLVAELPVAADALASWLEERGGITEDLVEEVSVSLEAIEWRSWASAAAQTVMASLVDVVSGFASGIANFVLALVFALFVLMGKRQLACQVNLLAERYLPAPTLSRVRYVAGIADDCFHRFLVGQVTEAAILGVLCAVGMLVLGLPHAWMIGALTAFMALIPIVGALLSGIVGAFLILMDSPVQALVFVIFIIVLQQLEGDFIYPHVVGSSIQLPGIWVLAAVTVGGGAFGVAGMFLGVPLAAVAYRLLRNDVHRAAQVPQG